MTSVTETSSQRQANELTAFEHQELESCESIVAYGISMFFAACNALRTIRDKRLYRATHPTWEAYIRERWSGLFSDDSTANRWIATAELNDQIAPIGVTITRESHAREITKYQKDIQVAVALVGAQAAAIEQRKPTASHFRHAGAVIAEMVATGAVELGDGQQHPVTEMLAASVVERRRESQLQHIEKHARRPIVEREDYALAGRLLIADEALEDGRRYQIKVYEL